jgi:Ca-activated chloride channel homolog
VNALRFGDLAWAHAFWVVPALALLFAFSFWRKRRALAVFATSALLAHLVPTVSWARQYVRATLVLCGAALLVVCLMRPQWGMQEIDLAERGIDIMVLLDCSRSMLAEDVSPNRLERAKTDLLDLLNALHGDRIGLIAFAGASQTLCPLTFDYGFFKTLLADVGVGTVALGGTVIGDAIRKALVAFQDEVRNYKVIILITDGEDQDSFPEKAAEKAAEKGIRIYSIGLGSEAPTSIPIKDESGRPGFVMDDEQGKTVHQTRMDAATLAKIAVKTGGKFFPVGTAAFNFEESYRKEIASVVPERELSEKREEHYVDRYQIFLALALACFLVEPFVRTRRRTAA